MRVFLAGLSDTESAVRYILPASAVKLFLEFKIIPVDMLFQLIMKIIKLIVMDYYKQMDIRWY